MTLSFQQKESLSSNDRCLNLKSLSLKLHQCGTWRNLSDQIYIALADPMEAARTKFIALTLPCHKLHISLLIIIRPCCCDRSPLLTRLINDDDDDVMMITHSHTSQSWSPDQHLSPKNCNTPYSNVVYHSLMLRYSDGSLLMRFFCLSVSNLTK